MGVFNDTLLSFSHLQWRQEDGKWKLFLVTAVKQYLREQSYSLHFYNVFLIGRDFHSP